MQTSSCLWGLEIEIYLERQDTSWGDGNVLYLHRALGCTPELVEEGWGLYGMVLGVSFSGVETEAAPGCVT